MRPYLKKILPSRFVIAFVLLIIHLQAEAQPSLEYQLKAVFLFNFTQFVEWPTGSFETDQSPLVIGILGENPFGTYLDETVKGELIKGHPVVIRYYKNVADVQSCHLLFINITESDKRKEAIEALKGKNILTVSDAPDFAAQGGMIRFFTLQNKIKLQINLEACRESKLVLSSKLLKLAEIFKSNQNN
ncbi:MAG: YfiR family protein [Sediminibacterium sp.]